MWTGQAEFSEVADLATFCAGLVVAGVRFDVSPSTSATGLPIYVVVMRGGY